VSRALRSRSRRVRTVAAAVALVALGAGLWVVRKDVAASPPEALDPPRFTEVSATAGLDQVYDGEFPFFVGGGVASFDCDADALPELYVAGGANPAGLFRNESTAGSIRFRRSPDPVTDLTAVTGAYPLELDGDGITDLAVLRLGENVLLRGRGDCRFERANEALGFDGGAEWTAAFSATWESGAALPTLALGNYLALEAGGTPSRERCAEGALVRPAASGTRYDRPIPLAPGYCALSVLFSDWSRSGRRDLRVSNDRHYSRDGVEQLWAIEPGRAPRAYGPRDGWRPLRIWGMGIASQDLTGDGYPEVYLTSQGDNKLQTLEGGPDRPTYRDMALAAGVTAHRPFVGGDPLPSTAWHPEFDDVNDDSFVDLFVAKGNVEAQTEYAMKDPSNLLIGQADGTFTEGAEVAGIVSFARARGAALEDLDLDGRLDLVVVNRREPVRVWRNEGVPGVPRDRARWMAVRLRQPAPNVDAVGAWLEIRLGDRTLWRELTVGGGHASGQVGWLHLGLGSHEGADVRVHWPDGAVDGWRRLDAGTYWTIERGSADPQPLKREG